MATLNPRRESSIAITRPIRLADPLTRTRGRQAVMAQALASASHKELSHSLFHKIETIRLMRLSIVTVPARTGGGMAGGVPRLKIRPEGPTLLHDPGAPAISSHWQPTSDNLAQHRHIRVDAIDFLRSTVSEPESSHHFVED